MHLLCTKSIRSSIFSFVCVWQLNFVAFNCTMSYLTRKKTNLWARTWPHILTSHKLMNLSETHRKCYVWPKKKSDKRILLVQLWYNSLWSSCTSIPVTLIEKGREENEEEGNEKAQYEKAMDEKEGEQEWQIDRKNHSLVNISRMNILDNVFFLSLQFNWISNHFELLNARWIFGDIWLI